MVVAASAPLDRSLKALERDAAAIRRAEKKRAIERQRREVARLRKQVVAPPPVRVSARESTSEF